MRVQSVISSRLRKQPVQNPSAFRAQTRMQGEATGLELGEGMAT